MIDYFALALTHGLILLALIRIVGRPDLDEEIDGGVVPAKPPKSRRGSGRAKPDA